MAVETLVQKIEMLAEQVGNAVQVVEGVERKRVLGSTSRNVFYGWLWIEEKKARWGGKAYWRVFLANGEKTHQPSVDDPCFAADFQKANGQPYRRFGLTGAWDSALSMWPVRDEKEATRIIDLVSSRINLAYKYHCESSGG